METYWVPAVNHSGTYGRWDFAEFTDVHEIESGFEAMVENAVNQMIDEVATETAGAGA
jgi:type III restriction enzyme